MVKFDNVSFAYNGANTNSLTNIGLSINSGECIVLCGRSGCGKTTITRLVNGLAPYFYSGEVKGNVTINEQNVSEVPFYQLSEKVGSVFQNPRSQFFNTDTDSEIAFGIENLGYPKEKLRLRVDETIHDLHIEKLAGRSLFELSGGEKQKVAFASVYAMSPDVFVLDEPSSNLDSDAIDDLRKIIAFLKEQGKTILIAEHRLYYLKDIADRIVYIKDGQICFEFTVKEFERLTDANRSKLGLRALNLKNIYPKQKNNVKQEKNLKLKDVTLRYGKNIVIDSFGFSVSRGECVGIIGHNGAGKSTFSRMLCGLHKDYDGTVLWENHNFDRKERLKRCYMVMQNVSYQLFAESVEKESCFGIKDANPMKIYQILDNLKLLEYKDKHPNTLSGGQKQRLAVATSIISGREILIFDEPTSGLDFDNMVRVSRLIESLKEMGKIIFIVTHDYEFICKTCTRILHFDNQQLKDDYQLDNDIGRKKLHNFFINDKTDQSRDNKIKKRKVN